MTSRLETIRDFVLSPFRRADANTARAAWTVDEPAMRTEYFEHASRAEFPRGLRWKRCEWPGQTRFARDRSNGRVVALVGVIVHFEAIEGDEMEDVDAVTLPRDATAVFQFDRPKWTTAGRTLFNMNPDDALSRLGDQIESLGP